MANTSGSAADVLALATAVSTFLTANGWTSNRFDTQGTGRRLELQKTYTSGTATLTMTAGMRFSNAENVTPFSPGSLTGVFLVCGTSYSGAADWHSQAGSPLLANGTSRGGVGAGSAVANISYWIFTDTTNDNVVLVFALSSTVFNYISWGTGMTKYGAWTGGKYFSGARGGANVGAVGGSRADSVTLPPVPPFASEGSTTLTPSTFVSIDEASSGEEWRGNNVGTAVATNLRTTRVLGGWISAGLTLGDNGSQPTPGCPNLGHLLPRSRSPLTNNALVFPLHMSTWNPTSTLWRPIGYHPTVRGVYIRGNLTNGSDITIASDTYTVFDNFAVLKV